MVAKTGSRGRPSDGSDAHFTLPRLVIAFEPSAAVPLILRALEPNHGIRRLSARPRRKMGTKRPLQDNPHGKSAEGVFVGGPADNRHRPERIGRGGANLRLTPGAGPTRSSRQRRRGSRDAPPAQNRTGPRERGGSLHQEPRRAGAARSSPPLRRAAHGQAEGAMPVPENALTLLANGSCCERGEARFARGCERSPIQPCREAVEVERHRCGHGLQMGLRQPAIACPTQTKGAHALRERALNAGS